MTRLGMTHGWWLRTENCPEGDKEKMSFPSKRNTEMHAL